jgi:hypothetical protein
VLAAGSAIVVAIIGLAVATGGLGATGSDQPFGGEPGANGTVQASEGA